MKIPIIKYFIIILIISDAISVISFSQTDPAWFTEYKTVIPAKHYDAGAIHEFFFGSHWRDIWTTPVKVGVIDINKYGGGLTPTEKGGGLQTKGLKFKGGDGKEYKFRSLDKDPKKTLPLELQESIAKDIVQDQISTSNPYAGFVVNAILDSAEVFHSEYTLVLLPNDPKLGEFQKEFAGLLGIMEIVPSEEQFIGSDKVIGTVKLLDRLNKEFDESVDSKAFLKARLLDIFFGDWDRHKDQWKWIRYEDGDKKVYKPFPMDRDQAFAKFDGLLPFIAAQNVPQLNNFGYSYPDMRFMTWSGRYIDQRFLSFLYKDQWDEVTNDVLSKLTNEIIDNAVKKLPPEVYSKAKEEITEKLKSRRDGLKEASNEYYEFVNSVVDIYATDKDDYIEIGSSNSQMTIDSKGVPVVNISIYKRNKDTGEKEGGVLRSKDFSDENTDEIRIYLQEGDDIVFVNGKNTDFPKIRIIGGDGKDEIVNNSDETIVFYDDGKKSKTKGSISWDKDKNETLYEKAENKLKKLKGKITKDEKDKYEDRISNLRYDPIIPPDKFYMTSFFPLFNFSPDIGPLFGGTYSYRKYGFRMDPYLYKLNFTAGYAPKKKDITGLLLDIDLDMLGVIKRSSLNFHARKSGIEVNNYFGQGNNTLFDKNAYDDSYYKVTHEVYTVDPTITFPRDKNLKFNIGLLYKNFDVKESDTTDYYTNLLTTKPVNLLGVTGGFEFDKRDHPTAPFSGYYFSINGGYFPAIFDKAYKFGRITGDIRGYLGYKENVSLALRVCGEKVIGDFPFFESAFLGGAKYLRGYASERFAGDGSVLGSAELRLKLFKMNVLLPETVGIFTFAETGRVFTEGESSNMWYTGYGGGLFMFLMNRDITFRFTYARSKEIGNSFYFGTGFSF